MSYDGPDTPSRLNSRMSSSASRTCAGSTAGLLLASSSTSGGWRSVSDILAASVDDERPVRSAHPVVLEQPKVVVERVSESCVLTEIVDQQLEIATEHLHGDTAAVRVPDV